MKGLFKSKHRPTPPSPELVRNLRDLLIYVDRNSATNQTKREEKFSVLRKVVLDMRTTLYGDDHSDPDSKDCALMAQEFFKDDIFRKLITCLPKLDLGTRQDVTHVVANLLRQRVNSQCVAAGYLEQNKDLIDVLIPGCEDSDIAISYGAILRDCISHQAIARHVLESEHMKKFFDYVQNPNFEIASDAVATFKVLLTRHKSTVADFLSRNYSWFFQDFNSKLLESPNYITRRQAIKLLGEMLLHHSNSSVMVKYVSSVHNMRILMNMLRDSNKNIPLLAFQVFKLFVANQNKPSEIVNVLVTNRSKLLRYFADFHSDKEEDEQFEADKARVVKEIAILEPTNQKLSAEPTNQKLSSLTPDTIQDELDIAC